MDDDAQVDGDAHMRDIGESRGASSPEKMDGNVLVSRARSVGTSPNVKDAQQNVSDGAPRLDCDVEWIDPIAMWCWESLKGKTCSICRVDLNEIAIVASESPNDAHDHASAYTDVYIGGCGHMFHRACIERWLRVRAVCPQCIQPWSLHEKKTATD